MYIKPRVVVIDETEYWDAELVQSAGKIYGVYLYDENRHVHACELTASYELNAFGVDILKNETCPEVIRDEIEHQWQLATERIMYVHTYQVEQLRVFKLDTQRCKADEYDECWESILEHYQGNWPYYELPEAA
jgi:hypothetical protein